MLCNGHGLRSSFQPLRSPQARRTRLTFVLSRKTSVRATTLACSTSGSTPTVPEALLNRAVRMPFSRKSRHSLQNSCTSAGVVGGGSECRAGSKGQWWKTASLPGDTKHAAHCFQHSNPTWLLCNAAITLSSFPAPRPSSLTFLRQLPQHCQVTDDIFTECQVHCDGAAGAASDGK